MKKRIKMKIKLGDKVSSEAFGSGTVVAISKEWCVYKAGDGKGEVALPWNEIYVPAEPGEVDSVLKEKIK